MYPSYAETVHVAPAEVFPLSDEVYSGRVAGYLPDFRIDDRGNVMSGSDSAANPAIMVEVYKGWERVQRNWAFPGAGAPHYRPTDLIGFRVLDIQSSDQQVKLQATPSPDPDEGTTP